LREVDLRTIVYAGLKRGATFLIKNGTMARRVQDVRCNASPRFMLDDLEALGTAERFAGTNLSGTIVMPSMKAQDVNFTSLSEAV
jgi:predicted Zn-dependent protease